MPRCAVGILLAALVLAFGAPARAEDDDIPAELSTVAEASRYRRTARSAEVLALIERLCARSAHLERFRFGHTARGQPMVAVKVARGEAAPGRTDPRLVVLLLGNIHSGECCGKEALLMLLRDIALDPDHPWLERLVLLVVPNYNADGNDDVGPNEERRRSQVGPEMMGTRANAMGLDLNRDFVKLASPEARALVGLMDAWRPRVFIDCHTTNGSWHRYALTYDVPHNPAAPAPVRALLREEMMPAVTRGLAARGIDTFYYGNFDAAHTRWTTYGHQPRYSTEYGGLRGMLAILSEAYSYIPFRDRIAATKAFVEACVSWVADHPDAVRRAAASGRTPPDHVPIAARVRAFEEPVVVRGYADPPPPPTRRGTPAGPRPTVARDHRVAFVGDYVAARTVRRPQAYAFGPELPHVAEKLMQHGIRVERAGDAHTLPAEVMHVLGASRSSKPFQGHRLTRAFVRSRKEELALAAGSYVVRTDQPLGTLACYLLEAESDDGFVTWEVLGEHFRVGRPYPIVRLLHLPPGLEPVTPPR